MVGDKEKHNVEIEMVRKLLLAGFRSMDYNVYIDGKLFKTFKDQLNFARCLVASAWGSSLNSLTYTT